MIGLYKENNEKYKKVLQYIEENTELSTELKQEIIEVVEKYRICIYTLEKEQIIEKIEKCQEEQNVFLLKRHFHELIFGNNRDTEVYEWEDEDEYEKIY